MPRYIDAEKAIEIAESNKAVLQSLGDIVDIREIVNDVPTADVQPVKHGKWILDEDSSSEEEKCYRCSNCKAILEEDYKWHNHNYCYHCGAKMDKKEATYIKDIFMTR